MLQKRSGLLKELISNNAMRKVEKRLRASFLRKSEQSVRTHNINPGRQYNQQLNEFSLMTGDERARYLGLLNTTLPEEDDTEAPPYTEEALTTVPDSFDHRDHGHVTSVKSQGSCGACWAFAAAGSFEGSYARETGVLKSFSAKELLDCSYPVSKGGCKGGWYVEAWKYIKIAGRLASEKDIPYISNRDDCSKWDGKPNGIRNAVYTKFLRTGTIRRPPSHEDVKRTIISYTPAVAFTVESDFFRYEVGHYEGCPTQRQFNHAIILVGYGPYHWEGKNSWGTDWGDKGFVKFTRSKESVCRVLERVGMPVVTAQDRGEPDESDPLLKEEVVDVARDKLVETSDEMFAYGAVDGFEDTCDSTTPSYRPSFKVNLERMYRVQRVEIVTDKPRDMMDGKVYIGTSGTNQDNQIGAIKEEEEGKAVIRPENPVEGSFVYLEVNGKRLRSLSVCEIRVYGTRSKGSSGSCPGGTTLCSDGVCRHVHMC